MVSLGKNKDELVYTFKSYFDTDTANEGTLPEPNKYTLASASMLNKYFEVQGNRLISQWCKHASDM
ncbi:hypothetical protein AbraIFM66950_002338 [Aspergillus brasiliensis]|nr:hypothetical protein AbraIFM66950_002338 [Aspergillus brasiliensis]